MRLDPVATLLLAEAGLEGLAAEPEQPTLTNARPPSILVIDEPALANQLHASGHGVLAFCDDLRDELQLDGPGMALLDQSTLAGVDLVLLRLPKSLGMLQDYAERIATWAAPGVRVLAGGREKHLTRGMNEVLGASFAQVRASLGRQKSRVLHAGDARPGPRTWPREQRLDEVGLTVISHGGVFAAGKLDGGTRLLLRTFGSIGNPGRAVDLGCGTGILACALARQGHQVLAVDASRAAVESARDTAVHNGLAIEVRRSDGLAGAPPATVDLLVCNPPFHRGTTKDSTPGFALLSSALPALAPGATVLTVFNSHLPYLPFLRAEVGPTSVIARDRHYTVTRSTRARVGT